MRPVLLALGLLLVMGGAGADEIVLKRGARLRGEVIDETEDSITLKLPHGTMKIPRSRIAEIVREERTVYLAKEAAEALRGGSTATAVELLEQAVREKPVDGELAAALADALAAHGRALRAAARLDAADAAYVRLLELDPEDGTARELRAEIAREKAELSRLRAAAEASLEAGRFREAIARYDAWRLRRPVGDPDAQEVLAEVHIAAGNAEMRAGRLRQALDHMRAAEAFGSDRVDKALFLLRPIAVLEALKVGELDDAARLLDSIETTYPDPAVPVFLDAVRDHVRGEVEGAVNGYARAARLAEGRDPPKRGLGYDLVRQYAHASLRASIARPPHEGAKRWRQVFLDPLRREESRHFVVFAATAARAKEIGAQADAVYASIARELLGGVPAARRAELVVHSSRQVYNAADRVPENSPWAAVFVPREQTGGVTYTTHDEEETVVRVETWDHGEEFEANTLPHELAHVVQHRGFKAFRKGAWFDEGVAMLFESPAGAARRLANLERGGEFLGLRELVAYRSVPADRMQGFYDQAYALTAYLRDLDGESGWKRFLGLLAEGDLETALRRAYRVESLEALERDFLAAIR